VLLQPELAGFDPPFRFTCHSSHVMSTPRNMDPHRAIAVSEPRAQSFKDVRLRRHSDYQRAYAASRKRQSASMSWFLAPQPEPGGPRVGLTAGKVLGKAHERNRIKRRMREVLRRHLELLPEGCDLILHPRRAVAAMEFVKLEAEVVRILEKARVEAARLRQAAAETRGPGPIQ